ncbi:hypothetical protein [Luteimonas sp. SDU101]|uniref:hypothetical protein n=1 Tax=Luteimonas sp. SDU101 TaxID=3422593 RepID=UPI003EBF5B7B
MMPSDYRARSPRPGAGGIHHRRLDPRGARSAPAAHDSAGLGRCAIVDVPHQDARYRAIGPVGTSGFVQPAAQHGPLHPDVALATTDIVAVENEKGGLVSEAAFSSSAPEQCADIFW